MAADKFDNSRPQVYVMMYLMPSVNAGVVRVNPQVHGLYETYQHAAEVRKGMGTPDNYFIHSGYWRKDER